MEVSHKLEEWYGEHQRDLPWRRSSSPYYIWLSEIILHQTRVNQGLEYFNKFILTYPRVEDLADAPLDEVLKLWQGLGYYSRARNLHDTAKKIVRDFKGVFPSSYAELLQLKGIGTYTAAAVASIAFREPVAVVDGNVHRVLSRIFCESAPVNTGKGKKIYAKLADQVLNRERPDIHNQAMMELGALVCLPVNPLCTVCPLVLDCLAYISGKTNKLPVKEDRKKVRDRYFNYFFIRSNNYTWLSRRENKDIWHSLYEFPLIETESALDIDEIRHHPQWQRLLGDYSVELDGSVWTCRHQLTHQRLHCNFYCLVAGSDFRMNTDIYFRADISRIHQYAVPRLIDKFMSVMKHEGRL